jgi:hypothetical protein
MQSVGTTFNEVEVTSSNPHLSSYVDISKKKKKSPYFYFILFFKINFFQNISLFLFLIVYTIISHSTFSLVASIFMN